MVLMRELRLPVKRTVSLVKMDRANSLCFTGLMASHLALLVPEDSLSTDTHLHPRLKAILRSLTAILLLLDNIQLLDLLCTSMIPMGNPLQDKTGLRAIGRTGLA